MISHSNWKLHFAKTCEEARTILQATDAGPIVSECCLPGGLGWGDLLQLTTAIHNGPPIIVTDRLADERLWAEVLNEGGYDVLMKPFESEEVFRIISYAWRSWRERCKLAAQKRPVTSEATPRSLYVASGA
jgi:DNA-binding NtrC family response regulator